VVLGTELGANALNKAVFKISMVPAGTYQLRASYVCYEPQTAVAVRVEAGQTTTIDFGLKKHEAIKAQPRVIMGSRPEDTIVCGFDAREIGMSRLSEKPIATVESQNGGQLLRLGAVLATPNPSNKQSVIQFELGSAQDVTVEIHDVRGVVVRKLFKGRLETGPRSVSWDGFDQTGHRAASGLYFVRVRSAGGVRHAKILRF